MALTVIKPSGLDTTGDYTVAGVSVSANLIATGNVNFSNTSNVSLGAVDNVHIMGGSNTFVLSTDGSGNLNWVAQSGGSGTDTWVRIQANSAYDAANSGASFANGAFTKANSSFLRANASYESQNTTASFANGAFDRANSAASFANGAFVRANSSYVAQNTTALFANGAFLTANSGASFANSAFLTANSGASFANSAFTKANLAFAHATAAFAAANTGGGGGSSINITVDSFTGDGSSNVFTLSTTPTNINQTVINYNGALVLRSDYSLNGNNITFNSTPANGSFIEVTTTNLGQEAILYYSNLHQPGELQILEGTARWYAPYDLEISVIRVRLGTAADGSVGLFLKKNGTTEKTITISSSSTQANIADQNLSMNLGDYLTVDVTNVGTTLKGEDLYIQIGYQKL